MIIMDKVYTKSAVTRKYFKYPVLECKEISAQGTDIDFDDRLEKLLNPKFIVEISDVQDSVKLFETPISDTGQYGIWSFKFDEYDNNNNFVRRYYRDLSISILKHETVHLDISILTDPHFLTEKIEEMVLNYETLMYHIGNLNSMYPRDVEPPIVIKLTRDALNNFDGMYAVKDISSAVYRPYRDIIFKIEPYEQTYHDETIEKFINTLEDEPVKEFFRLVLASIRTTEYTVVLSLILI